MSAPFLKKTATAFGVITLVAASLTWTESKESFASTNLLLSGLISPAHAVVGRPMTPVSYAGTARRTAWRTSRRHEVYEEAYD